MIPLNITQSSGKCQFNGCVLALLATVNTVASAAGGTLPPCPPAIETSQEVHNGPKGWTAASYAGRQALSRVTFKLADDPGELRPDEENRIGGERVLVWRVADMDGLQQVCEYAGTLARLTRPVAGRVARCEVVMGGTGENRSPIAVQCR
jgi:hypothetical protein